MIKINKNHIIIETKNTSLILEIKSFDDNATPYILGRYYLTCFYYGNKSSLPKFIPSNQKLNFSGSCNDYSYDLMFNNTFGDANNVEGSLLIKNVDGSFVNRFFFKEAKIINDKLDSYIPHSRNAKETLLIIEEDKEANLELLTYYSIFDDSDVIAIKRKLINNNSSSIYIRNFASMQLPIKSKELDIYTYDGSWLYERTRHVTTLTSGVFMNESILFSSSHKHNPFIQIENKTDKKCYAFNLIWSGNHKEFIDLDSVKQMAVISVGINSYCFDYELKSNESFLTPEAVLCEASSIEETSKVMRDFVNKHIIDQKWNKPRPILFNSWEGSVFDINDDNLFKMADVCKNVGIELFVIDDGWFGNRNDDKQSLGDWFENKEKFPNGFGNTAKVIKSKGLGFGFWIEPEMISIISEIYKNHPEYACISKSREPIERRHQLMIDMSNPNVSNYLFDSLSKVFEETKPNYIKWDFNRNMSEAYSSYGTPAGEFMYKYVLGSYELMYKLTNKYPNILFEGCSSGGGRFDLGICYYMSQTWGSDNSNAYCRSFISCGTFAGYPQSTFGAHVSRDYCPIKDEGHFSSLEDRFNIQCVGCFGYEFDVSKLPSDDLLTLKEQISFYKKYRELIQFGELEIIDNIFDNSDYLSYQITSFDKNEAIYLAIQTRPNLDGRSWIFKNLKPDAKYKVQMRQHLNMPNFNLIKDIYLGKKLMEFGLTLPNLDKDVDTNIFNGIFSRIFYLKEI